MLIDAFELESLFSATMRSTQSDVLMDAGFTDWQILVRLSPETTV